MLKTVKKLWLLHSRERVPNQDMFGAIQVILFVFIRNTE
jgi:hypothetical protein